MIKYLPLLLLIACGKDDDAAPPTYRCEFKEDFKAEVCTWMGCFRIADAKRFSCVSSAGLECEASYYTKTNDLLESTCPKGFENFLEEK